MGKPVLDLVDECNVGADGRKMLKQAARFGLQTPKGNRHSLQESAINMLFDVLADEKEAREHAAEQINKEIEEADARVVELTEAIEQAKDTIVLKRTAHDVGLKEL